MSQSGESSSQSTSSSNRMGKPSSSDSPSPASSSSSSSPMVYHKGKLQFPPHITESTEGTIDRILFRSPRLGQLFGLRQPETQHQEEDPLYLGKMILMAANRGDLTTINACIAKGGSIAYVNTALEGAAFFAATQGLSFLQQVHKLGAPLHLVTRNSQTIPHQLSRFPDTAAFDYVLSNGAVLGTKTWNSQNELHLAANTGNHVIVEYLLRKGIPADSETINNATPLHYAIRYGCSESVSHLLKAGANPNKRTVEWHSGGDVPLHLAGRRKHKKIITSLIQAGANLNGCKLCSKSKACPRIEPKWLEFIQSQLPK